MAVVTQTWHEHTFTGMSSPHFHSTIPTSRSPHSITLKSTPSRPSGSDLHVPMTNNESPRPRPIRNSVELSREELLDVLTYFSSLIPSYFHLPVRLVVHGGACMLLHPGLYDLAKQQQQLVRYSPSGSPHNSLPWRTKTRDVDFIHRSFVTEWASLGMPDAAERLKRCIQKTARRFSLGEDWMNGDADVSLPMATDASGKQYDPIYTDSIKSNNIASHTVFSSKNLTLISVNPFWSVAFKLVRYSGYDQGDICLILRNGTTSSKVRWTASLLEKWLFNECWAMGYSSYDNVLLQQLRSRIQHAVDMVSQWYPESGHPTVTGQLQHLPSQPVLSVPPLQNHSQVNGNGMYMSPPPQPLPMMTPGLIPRYHPEPVREQTGIFIPPDTLKPSSTRRKTKSPVQLVTAQSGPPQQLIVENAIPQRAPTPFRDRRAADDDDYDPGLHEFTRQHRRERDRDRRPSTTHTLHHRQAPQSGKGIDYTVPTVSEEQRTYQRSGTPLPSITNFVAAGGSHVRSAPISPHHGNSHNMSHHTAFEQSVADVLAEGRMNYDISRPRHAALTDVVIDQDNERRNKEKHRARDRKRDRLEKLRTLQFEADEEEAVGTQGGGPLENTEPVGERWAEEARIREKKERRRRKNRDREDMRNGHPELQLPDVDYHVPPPESGWSTQIYAPPTQTGAATTRVPESFDYRYYGSQDPPPEQRMSRSRHHSTAILTRDVGHERNTSRSEPTLINSGDKAVRRTRRSRSRHGLNPEILSPIPQLKSLKIF